MSLTKRPEQTPIHSLQMMLRTVVPEQGLGLDGLFGKETQAAVAAFQKQQGLQESGAVDQETWDALVLAYELEDILLSEAEPLRIILQPKQVIGRGSRNLHLPLVQGMLLALGRLYLDLPAIRVTGILDDPTANALIWLQRASNLPQTGELDKNTWRHLAKQYRMTIGDGTGTYPVRTVQRSADDTPR